MTVEQWLGESNQIGIDIWNSKYKNGNETFDEWLDRISNGDETLRQLIVERKFLFGGRILASRGLQNSKRKITFSNCYVMPPVEDSIESIFQTASDLAKTYSRGGGCGVDISGLSPRGARINNAAKETSGAVSFMELFDTATKLIGQSGRRGALMISMSCNHPDIEEFIDIKKDLDKITKANISIRVTNEFIDAVIHDLPYELRYVREATGEVVSKTIKAKDLFDKIVRSNWEMGEPGMLFWDRIENYNMLHGNSEFKYAGVNPCAEEPLPAGGSCLLGSINLSEFVINPFSEDPSIDFKAFEKAVRAAVRALNDVLDEGLPLHPLNYQTDSVRDWRQIGLGIMGLADMLLKLNYRYGSEDAISFCDSIASLFQTYAILESIELAKKNGSYNKFDPEVLNNTYFSTTVHNDMKQLIRLHGIRNSQILTIAPTGTLSTMLGISGGMEPIFANSYNRKTESLHGKDVVYKVYTPIVMEYMKLKGIADESQLPEIFVVAPNLTPDERIGMQAVWQKYIDASISSTVNLPNSATVEDIKEVYLKAWANGLKGITVFRDDCFRAGILTTDKEPEKPVENKKSQLLQRGDIIDSSDFVVGKKRKLITGCGSLHCTAFFDPVDSSLMEVFLSKGSTGGCQSYMVGLSRMISIAARAGVDIYTIADQLSSSVACPSYAVRRATKGDASKGSCCPMAIGNALIDMWEEMKSETNSDSDDEEFEDNEDIQYVGEQVSSPCPECGCKLYHESGCTTCKSCGYSKCG